MSFGITIDLTGDEPVIKESYGDLPKGGKLVIAGHEHTSENGTARNLSIGHYNDKNEAVIVTSATKGVAA